MSVEYCCTKPMIVNIKVKSANIHDLESTLERIYKIRERCPNTEINVETGVFQMDMGGDINGG